MKRYIYIDESGDVGIGTTAPTEADYDSIDNGILQVIEVTGSTIGPANLLLSIKDVAADRSLVNLQPAVLAKPEDDESGPYHWVKTT